MKVKSHGKAKLTKRLRQLGAGYSGDIVLHIGKTGGSYLSDVLAQVKPSGELVNRFSHSLNAQKAFEMCPNGQIVFAVREPSSLFVSAFNSRLRKGQPRYNVEWSPAEAIAFRIFHTPNELAEALSSADPLRKACAEFAMLSIVHVNKCMKFYLRSAEYLEKNKHRIGYILDQSHLDDDIKKYLVRIGVDSSMVSPVTSEIQIHKTPAGYEQKLSQEALENLSQWYADDLKIFEWCRRNKAAINSASRAPEKIARSNGIG